MQYIVGLFVLLFGGYIYGMPVKSLDVATFSYPPYIMGTRNNGAEGLLVEIFEEAIKPMNLKVKYHIFPLRRAVVEILKPEKLDKYVHLGTARNFEKEIKKGLLSNVTLTVGAFTAFAPAQSPLLRISDISIEKLKSHKIAALRGSSIVPLLVAAGIAPLEVSDLSQLFKVLESGRVEASVVLELSGDFFLKTQSKLNIKKIQAPLAKVPLSFLISPKHPLYKEIFAVVSENIEKLKASGKLRKIAERYYGIGQVPDYFFSK